MLNLMLALLVPYIVVTPVTQAQVFADRGNALVDYAKAESAPGKSCESLGRYRSEELVQIAAAQIPADGPTPEFCRVAGVLAPEIAFEVSLPAAWNGRFYMFGNGGHAGEALDNPGRVGQRNAALQLGFAVAQTNTGHDAAKEPGATFVLSNPQKAIDYAYRAVHLTAVTAKSITADYYSRPVARAYWNSCSNGGRQGLIEAQRYPDDFDGVVANAPWVDQTGFTIGAMWNQKALTEASVTGAQMERVAEHVMAKCDAIDGLEDRLIDDPRRCDFDPARDVPSCGTDGEIADCLTPAQAAALAKVYRGPVRNGKPFFPGFEPGSEAVMNLFGGGTGSGWMNVIISANPEVKPADFNLAENTMRYLVHRPPQPDYDYRTFDFDRDIHMLDEWGRLANANNPDLSAFRRRGGKLIMTYGWADAILQPRMGINYYEQAVAVNGADTPGFFRLFMIPGMAHCAGGTGPDRHDPMTAIINWVEAGKAPDAIMASRVVNDQVMRTRPLCPYPQVARYSGRGSIDDGANFHCVTPSTE
jgi:feruloyl esterase